MQNSPAATVLFDENESRNTAVLLKRCFSGITFCASPAWRMDFRSRTFPQMPEGIEKAAPPLPKKECAASQAGNSAIFCKMECLCRISAG